MSKILKWAIVLCLMLGTVLIANAAQLSNYYMPVVYVTNPTATRTPIPTKTATPTKTPAPGECLTGKTSGLCIINIDYQPKSGGALNESITIKNLGSSPVDLEFWRVVNDRSEKFDIPEFSLNGNTTVKIWTKTGTNDSTNLYMDRTDEFWNNVSDCAYLRDDSQPRKTIDAICYGISGLFFAPSSD